ncbi:MAG: ribosome biogenesis GTPase YlqF [Clostridia bacterium]|nr:ribosome biogenesis GTPase YlqF [Clostridia bacterium]
MDNNKKPQMADINWYPGHMAKAKRKIQECLKLVDAVVELVDARIPDSSRNPDFDVLFSAKPRIIVLNKSDLANDIETKKWLDFYNKKNCLAIAMNSKIGKSSINFIDLVKGLLKDQIEKNKRRGILNKTIRMMVVGIPNVGKSSFINNLVKGRRTKVENRPGVTQSTQWYLLRKNVELLDTPGVLWPKIDDRAVAEKLAFCGAIKDQILDIEGLAGRFLIIIKDKYRQNLIKRYKLPEAFWDYENVDGYDILREIGKKRGMLLSGGEVDISRAAETILGEFRSAKLGKITLDDVPNQ